MGVNTKFRTNKIGGFIDVQIILEKALGTSVSIEVDSNFESYCRYFFTFNDEKRTMWLFSHSIDAFKMPNPEFNNIFDLGYNETAIMIMRTIAPYFGGWLKENDCNNDPEIFIPESEELSNIPQTNAEKLYRKIAETNGIIDAEKVLAFIIENKGLLIGLNFGKDV